MWKGHLMIKGNPWEFWSLPGLNSRDIPRGRETLSAGDRIVVSSQQGALLLLAAVSLPLPVGQVPHRQLLSLCRMPAAGGGETNKPTSQLSFFTWLFIRHLLSAKLCAAPPDIGKWTQNTQPQGVYSLVGEIISECGDAQSTGRTCNEGMQTRLWH